MMNKITMLIAFLALIFGITGMAVPNTGKVLAFDVNDIYAGKDAVNVMPAIPIVALPVAVILAIIFIVKGRRMEE